MPFFLTHIYHLKVNNLINQPGVLAGSLLPDIRYLLSQKRETTHFNEQLFERSCDSWGQFKAKVKENIDNNKISTGYAAHLFLDILWSKHISPLYNNKLEELGVKIALELFLVEKIDQSILININSIFLDKNINQFQNQSLKEWGVFIQEYLNALFDSQNKYFDFLRQQTVVKISNLDNIFEITKNKLNDAKEIDNILNSGALKL